MAAIDMPTRETENIGKRATDPVVDVDRWRADVCPQNREGYLDECKGRKHTQRRDERMCKFATGGRVIKFRQPCFNGESDPGNAF